MTQTATNIESSSVLEVESVKTIFGNNHVHKDITFTLQRGSLNAIIGESGCGKSVLLREIIGLLRPSGGNIKLLDHNVWTCSSQELQELRSRYSVLFQDGALFSALTVGENVATPISEHLQIDDSFLQALVDLRLTMSGLSPNHRDKMPSELSGGMRKRAALARALALEPEVLFLDEPTSGLDPITARSFDKLIRTLVDSIGITVLLVTHDIDSILGIVDNLIVLGGGRVLAEGPVNQIMQLDRPWIQQYFSSRDAGNE